MNLYKRGDVVTVPEIVLLDGIRDQCGLPQEDITIYQYRAPSGRLCIVNSVNKHQVTVSVNFYCHGGMRFGYVNVPLALLTQQGDDHTIKVSSLDYDSSDVLSDEDKLIIKEYMQNV